LHQAQQTTMSKRNKLLKFTEILTYPNVLEHFDVQNPLLTRREGELVSFKGTWQEQYFKNTNPITLELACGKGDYTLGLARQFANRNFIGIDVKGARIWRGAKTALEEELNHVAFIRARIEMIDFFFAPNEVEEVWITFPDPFLEPGKMNRRLTSTEFLTRYQSILPIGCLIHLKTDSPELYQFTLETLKKNSDYELIYHNADIYANPPLYHDALQLKTVYEKTHLKTGKTIKYVQIRRIQ